MDLCVLFVKTISCFYCFSIYSRNMANQSGNMDSMDSWTKASSKSVRQVLSCNPSQMMALLKSCFLNGADEGTLRAAIESCGGSAQQITKALPMSPWQAVDAPSNTTLKGLTQTITRTLKQPSVVNPVANSGTTVIVDKCWCGVNLRSYAEVSVGVPLPLPGTLSSYGSGNPAPLSLTQLAFGPQTQASAYGQVGQVYGIYGIPQFMTPPLRTTDGGYPPYSVTTSGGVGWSPSNGYLFNPGTLYPYINSSSAQSATFSAIMVLRNAKDQPQNSVELAALYSSGRRITSMANLYMTANASGTSASGVGSAAFVPSITVPSFGPSVLESQGSSNSVTQATIVRSSPGDVEGIRSILATNVEQVMKYLEPGAITGGIAATVQNVYTTLIGASGIDFSAPLTTATVPQAVSISGSASAPNVLANGIWDMQRDGYARGLWLSDKTTNSSGTFCKTRELTGEKCGLAGATGFAINGLYPTVDFSVAYATTTPIQNIQLPLGNDDAPFTFKIHWNVIGGASSGSLGSGCHVFAQIIEDDTISYKMVPFGLPMFGSAAGCMGYIAGQGGFGVVPGATLTNPAIDITVPTQPDGFSFTRQYTWMGTFLMLAAMPQAQLEVDIDLLVPLENNNGITGPAYVYRVDGGTAGQQLVFSQRNQYEVLSNAATRAVDNKSGTVVRPMIDARFPGLLRDLFASENAEFFKLVYDEKSWCQRAYTLLTQIKTSDDFIALLRNQHIVRDASDPTHERITGLLVNQVLQDDKSHILDDHADKIEELSEDVNALKRNRQSAIDPADVSSDVYERVSNAFGGRLERLENVISDLVANASVQSRKRDDEDDEIRTVKKMRSSVGADGGQMGADGGFYTTINNLTQYVDVPDATNNSTGPGSSKVLTVIGRPWLSGRLGYGGIPIEYRTPANWQNTVVGAATAYYYRGPWKLGFMTAGVMCNELLKPTLQTNMENWLRNNSHFTPMEIGPVLLAFLIAGETPATAPHLASIVGMPFWNMISAFNTATGVEAFSMPLGAPTITKAMSSLIADSTVEDSTKTIEALNLPNEQYLCVAVNEEINLTVILPGASARKLLKYPSYIAHKRLALKRNIDMRKWNVKHPEEIPLTPEEVDIVCKKAIQYWNKTLVPEEDELARYDRNVQTDQSPPGILSTIIRLSGDIVTMGSRMHLTVLSQISKATGLPAVRLEKAKNLQVSKKIALLNKHGLSKYEKNAAAAQLNRQEELQRKADLNKAAQEATAKQAAAMQQAAREAAAAQAAASQKGTVPNPFQTGTSNVKVEGAGAGDDDDEGVLDDAFNSLAERSAKRQTK